MTYFKLDIPKTNENLSRYNEIKNNCLEDIGFVYNGLGYTESGWNDPNAYNFIEKVKRDKYKVHEYFEYLNSLYGEIDSFKTNIDKLCSKQGYRKNTITLKFDDSDIQQVNKYLENARWYLNDSLNRIIISDFGTDFDSLDLIYSLRSKIKSVRNSINNMIEDMTDFVKSVNDEVIDSSVRLKRLGKYDFVLKESEYKWSVTDLNVKKVDISDLYEYSNVPISIIKDNTKSVNLASNEFINAKVNKIETEDNEVVKGLNNNLDTNLANQVKIEEKEFENIQGLNNNLNNNFAKENNIVFEDVEQIKGINNNLNLMSAKQKEIETEKVENVQGLNNNLNSSFADQNNIVFEDKAQIKGINDNLNTVSTTNITIESASSNEVQGLKENVNESHVNTSNVNFNTTKSNNISDNIVNAKANNNSIDYRVNSNVNFTDNVSSVNVKQANIDTSNIVSKNYDLGSGISVADPSEIKINSNINKNVSLNVNINKMESLKDISDK